MLERGDSNFIYFYQSTGYLTFCPDFNELLSMTAKAGPKPGERRTKRNKFILIAKRCILTLATFREDAKSPPALPEGFGSNACRFCFISVFYTIVLMEADSLPSHRR